MKQLLNTLYVQTQGTYVHLDHDTLKLDVERSTKFQVPLHHLGGIVVFGNVLVSPFLIHRCAEDGRSLVWLTERGQFKARLAGSTTGNVLLRRSQHSALDREDWNFSQPNKRNWVKLRSFQPSGWERIGTTPLPTIAFATASRSFQPSGWERIGTQSS